MRNIPVQFNMEKCSRRAEELFLKEAGISGEGEKYERMRRAAFAIREEIETAVQLKARCSFYENFRLEGQALTARSDASVTLECTAFQQIDPDSVEGVYVYAVTAGDFHLQGRPIMDQLYADIWGAAFTDAAREVIVDLIQGECQQGADCDISDIGISDSFGPGFYGMDPVEMHKMPLLVDFRELGMKVNESGIIMPLKSCAGILFKVNDLYKRMNSACETCSGNRKNCNLCRR